MRVNGQRGMLPLPLIFHGLLPMVETENVHRQKLQQEDPLKPSRGLALAFGLAVIFWSLLALLVLAYRQI